MPETVSPRPLLDRLGVRPGARVGVVGVDDPGFIRLLRERTSDVLIGAAAPASEVVVVAVDAGVELGRVAAVRSSIRPNGAIWVVSRKGPTATLRDVDVIEFARANGLVDNKVVSFSATHTALRLVIPVALRPRE
jgi:hypothetical protein